jgi:probable F420-dependent oxidoreductase
LSAWPGGDSLPQAYYEALDPIVAMTAAAAATVKLRVGCTALLVQRDPIQFAKEIASLDVLSHGRIEVGVAGGWNREEMRDHGTDPRTRWSLLRERVEAVRAIWTAAEPEYHGRFVDFGPMISNPKPVQTPHPRVHIGGAAPAALERVVAYGDGWVPLRGRGDDHFPEHVATLRRLAADAGREPMSLHVTVCNAPSDRATLDAYREAGVDAVLFSCIPSATLEARLDQIAGLRDEMVGSGFAGSVLEAASAAITPERG